MESRRFLDIHLEGIDDRGDRLKFFLDENVAFAISPSPFYLRDGIYSDSVLSLVERIINGNGILGQQGDKHRCKYPHQRTDPWHENFCLYNPELSYQEQLELMKKGRETIVKYLGKSPQLYVPPNHLFDETTLQVANIMGYRFFADRGVVNKTPYDYRNMVVLPEVKLGKNGVVYYAHYDELKNKSVELSRIFRNLAHFSTILPGQVSNRRRKFNQKAIRGLKIARDIRGLLR